MLNLLLRTIFVYFLTLGALRLMGKREVGELTPFDLVVSLMIAELGVIVIEQRNTNLIDAVIPLVTLASIELIVSYLSLKNSTIRRLINGTPSILIRNGKIDETEMRKSRYSIHDLLMQLHENSIFNPSDVEFAILETSGDLTVIPKSQHRGLTPNDLGIATKYEGIPTLLITDGEINYNGLDKVNLDEAWLLKELKKRGIEDFKDVMLAVLETDGELYTSIK
ncbi:hypothetical protein U472_11605 [Orenia metallireducens]|uniref:YetF C-terminal domain-containing protein n=1 Tax=Orenia metallireducens TaxID=1413210 RepID=A0A1C0A8S5_9FIRM|nr:hypothetical protein U472_11605 [Orenia metallireducens]